MHVCQPYTESNAELNERKFRLSEYFDTHWDSYI